jgi:hypothetical protein
MWISRKITPADIPSVREVVNTHKECEMVCALNTPEAEAIPLQRTRRRQYMGANICRRHFTILRRHKFDIGGVADGPPDDVFRVLVVEPAVVRVVPAKMRVDSVRHGGDVAHTDDVPGANAQARHIKSVRRMLAKPPKMLGLLIAGRDSTYGCLPGFRTRGRRLRAARRLASVLATSHVLCRARPLPSLLTPPGSAFHRRG